MNRCATAEHPIHAPSRDNPWDLEFLPAADYTCQLRRGVYHIYDKSGGLRDYPYQDLEKFFTDFRFLCTIIADGPL